MRFGRAPTYPTTIWPSACHAPITWTWKFISCAVNWGVVAAAVRHAVPTTSCMVDGHWRFGNYLPDIHPSCNANGQRICFVLLDIFVRLRIIFLFLFILFLVLVALVDVIKCAYRTMQFAVIYFFATKTKFLMAPVAEPVSLVFMAFYLPPTCSMVALLAISFGVWWCIEPVCGFSRPLGVLMVRWSLFCSHQWRVEAAMNNPLRRHSTALGSLCSWRHVSEHTSHFYCYKNAIFYIQKLATIVHFKFPRVLNNDNCFLMALNF